MSNIDELLDNQSALFDISSPAKADERRYVNSTAVTFSASLVAGKLYEVVNESNDSVAFYRVDGTNPALTYGQGDSFNGGVPILPFEKALFRLTGSATHSLRVIVSGSANITLFCHD